MKRRKATCGSFIQGSMMQLPGELVEEILCRVPATSVKRVRSTCKRWNGLFNDKRFTSEHSVKAPKQFMSLMLTKKYRVCPMSVNYPSVEVKGELSLADPQSLQFDVERVFHCDGLLLCTSADRRMVVWNPLTGRTRWIDAGEDRMKRREFCLGYSQDKRSCSKSYKVLSFHLLPDRQVLEMYDLDSDSWRILDGNIAPRWAIVCSDHMVSLKGNTYWFVCERGKPHLGLSLLSFDFSADKFARVPLPCRLAPRFEVASFSVVREEKLSVLLQQGIGSKAEVWVTDKIGEANKAVSWSKVLALDLSPDLQISFLATFLLDEEKKVVACCDRWIHNDDVTYTKDWVYVVGEDNKVPQEEIVVEDFDGCWPALLTYFPTLAQLE